MGRTWLLRGCAVAVFAVLGSAWATGVVALGDSPAPAKKHTESDAPPSPAAVHIQRGSVLERAKPRGAREGRPAQAAYTEPSPTATATGEPTDGAPGTPTPDPSNPSSPGHTHSPSGPSGGDTGAPDPSDDPSTTPPTQPSDDCTELTHVLSCVLAPAPRHP